MSPHIFFPLLKEQEQLFYKKKAQLTMSVRTYHSNLLIILPIVVTLNLMFFV